MMRGNTGLSAALIALGLGTLVSSVIWVLFRGRRAGRADPSKDRRAARIVVTAAAAAAALVSAGVLLLNKMQ